MLNKWRTKRLRNLFYATELSSVSTIKTLYLPVISCWFPTISIILANTVEEFPLSGILLNCSYVAEAAAVIPDTSLLDTQFSKQLWEIGTIIILAFTNESSKSWRSLVTYSGSITVFPYHKSDLQSVKMLQKLTTASPHPSATIATGRLSAISFCTYNIS